MSTSSTAPDLTQQPPRSPRVRVGGYVILGRTTDKCRALLNGNIGDYHYDCPLDNMLFSFAGVKGDALKEQVQSGASDDAIVRWLEGNGTSHTAEEVTRWSEEIEQYSMVNADDPEKRDYFIEETTKLGLDPHATSLFDWLEADDRASHGQ